jgi:WD40 repeat protein
VRIEPAGELRAVSVDCRMALIPAAHGPEDAGEQRRGSQRLVLAGQREFAIVDVETGEAVHPLAPYPGLAATPSISTCARWAFTGAWKGESRARVRDLETGETVLEIQAEHVVGAFSPTPPDAPDAPPLLVVGTGGWFAAYQPAADGGWRQVWRLERDNTDAVAGVLAFSGDGSLLALGRSRFALDLVEPRTGRLIATIDSPDRRALAEVAISPDGRWIAAATTSDLLQIINLGQIREELRDLGLDWERAGEVER